MNVGPFSLRQTLAPLPLACFLACLLSPACGGGGGSSKSATTPPVVAAIPEGYWQGSGTGSNQDPVGEEALVLGDGTMQILSDANDLFTGTLQQGVAQGRGYDLTLAGPITPFPLTAKVTSTVLKANFAGTLTDSSNNTVNFSFPTYNAAYDQPLTAAALAGTYAGNGLADGQNLPFNVTLNADGTLTGETTEFSVSGTFTVPDATKSAIKLALTVIPSDGSASKSMTGLGMAFLPSSPSGRTLLKVGATGADGGFTAQVTHQ